MRALTLQRLPFDLGQLEKRDRRLPEYLPLTLFYDNKLGIIRQKINKAAARALITYYQLGGYASTPLGEGSYAKRQGDEIIAWIKTALAKTRKKLTSTKFLEIGAGYGYLLYVLKQAGAPRVLGLEPGKGGVVGSARYRVPIIRDFFPSRKLREKFDYVFSYGTFEHIPDPLQNLKESWRILNDGGIVFVGVPDVETKMAVGDPSVISHQHVNYFTGYSLKKILMKAGFRSVTTISSPQRSLLIGFGVKAAAKNGQPEKTERKKGASFLALFQKNLRRNIKAIQKLIRRAEHQQKTIGLYGARCSTLAGLLKFKKAPRIFDSDVKKHGKYVAGLRSAVESPKRLKQNPPDLIIITPIDYDQEITTSLKKILKKKRTTIVSLKKIYEAEAGIRYN